MKTLYIILVTVIMAVIIVIMDVDNNINNKEADILKNWVSFWHLKLLNDDHFSLILTVNWLNA